MVMIVTTAPTPTNTQGKMNRTVLLLLPQCANFEQIRMQITKAFASMDTPSDGDNNWMPYFGASSYMTPKVDDLSDPLEY